MNKDYTVEEIIALLPMKKSAFMVAVDEYMLDKEMGVEMNGKLAKLQESYIEKVNHAIHSLEDTLKLLNIDAPMDTIEGRIREVFAYISSAPEKVEEQRKILIGG